MRTISWAVAAVFSVIPAAVVAQQQQAAPTGTGEDEGFFRPAADPAINRPPPPPIAPAPASPEAAVLVQDPIEAAARAAATEVVERQLDRARGEHDRGVAEASPQPAPMITSPLDGTARILSPLDGTAPIVSPLDR